MSYSKYLIVGSSHAGLSALAAIRVRDPEGSLTMVTREEHLPYSPTILPYVVSGHVSPERVFLRYEDDMERLGVDFRRKAKVVAVDSANHHVTLESGETLEYGKLLLATGAAPTLPPFPGVEDVPSHVLRDLDDALRLRSSMGRARSAIVLGAGLIAMHAAENLAKGGLKVTVEVRSRVLRGYFDEQSASLIQKIFSNNGIEVMAGKGISKVRRVNGGCAVSLDSGEEIAGDLLVVATGVKPSVGYLAGSGIQVDEGIIVDERMRTSVTDVWAAGDVTQASGFFDPAKKVDATLPNAVEQGRVAGMDIVGDPHIKPYLGGIGLNTYNFFGNRAFSVGLSNVPPSARGVEVDQVFLPTSFKYQKLVFQEDRLVGVSAINMMLDPGVMCQLVRRRVELKEFKGRLASEPLETGRILMSRIWR